MKNLKTKKQLDVLSKEQIMKYRMKIIKSCDDSFNIYLEELMLYLDIRFKEDFIHSLNQTKMYSDIDSIVLSNYILEARKKSISPLKYILMF